MKMIKTFAITVLSAGLLFTSCKKEEDSDRQTREKDYVEANVDGLAWSGASLSWASSGGLGQVNGYRNDGSSLQIFYDEGVTGTFDVNDNVATVSFNDGSTTYSNNVSGSITITANSATLIEGTFSVRNASYFANDTLNMTNGRFRYSFN